MDKIKADRFDTTRHMRTQLSYFGERFPTKNPFNLTKFKIVKLEHVQDGMDQINNKLEGYDNLRLPLTHSLASSTNTTAQHNLTLLCTNKRVLRIIERHFAVDFIAFGYRSLCGSSVESADI